MGKMLGQMKVWGCPDPDYIGTPEYRVLYETLSQSLASSMAADASIPPDEVALASLREFISQAERLRGWIVQQSGKIVSPETRGRIQILNWRRDGDDESYCRVEVFAVDDTTEVQCLVEKEHGLRCCAEDDGDYAATYYVNDDITFTDGEVMIGHDGRLYRVGVVLAENLSSVWASGSDAA